MTRVTVNTGWVNQAACGSIDPEALFAEDLAQQTIKVLCTTCPVRIECLAHALDNRIDHGVWGGMTERERRMLLRRRPSVTSWHREFHKARTERARLPKAV
ncbi:WhiB family transcriptional regulator [Streptomyces phaeochromogenes]|uniref:WhiB family transcriptional regulator n=1 Tax=Streptomyces phaeochromogenes TaxID=1923 RepID=UPI0033F2836D|nr:WhiB family transcriptional regulator [Streptomyces phaeochromogenes]